MSGLLVDFTARRMIKQGEKISFGSLPAFDAARRPIPADDTQPSPAAAAMAKGLIFQYYARLVQAGIYVDYQEAFSKTTFGLSMTRNFRNPICTWMSFDFNAKNGWDFRYRGTAIIGRHNLEMLAQEAYRRICDLESRKLPCVVSAIGVNLRPKNYQNALS